MEFRTFCIILFLILSIEEFDIITYEKHKKASLTVFGKLLLFKKKGQTKIELGKWHEHKLVKGRQFECRKVRLLQKSRAVEMQIFFNNLDQVRKNFSLCQNSVEEYKKSYLLKILERNFSSKVESQKKT